MNWIKELREKAEKAKDASRSKWSYQSNSSDGPVLLLGPDCDDRWLGNLNTGVWNCDDPEDGCADLRQDWNNIGEHIASANPETVLRLCAIAEAAQDLVEFLDNDIGMDKPELTALRHALKEGDR